VTTSPLRVLQVVSLISPHGEYGGPTRVAFNQSRALADAGHQVIIAAGQRGFPRVPATLYGVPVQMFPIHRLVPGTGFAGICAPGLMRWVASVAQSADVLHIHLARDLLTMPVALLAQRLHVPYVVQTHGMIDPSDKVLARVLDAVATRRVLKEAVAAFYLTEQERTDLQSITDSQLALVGLRNGTYLEAPSVPASSAATSTIEVLYLARLHARKRPMDFVKAAATLLCDYPEVTFRLIGPDEGEGKSVAQAIRQIGSPRLRWDGPVSMDQATVAMANAAVYVLPSVDEPYPMTVLEAMSHGCPVVVTESCGLAPLVTRSGSGLVTSPDSSALRTAVERLLLDPQRRRSMGHAARRTVATELNMQAVTQTLLSAYSTARFRNKE
jgi:glycosyltransferase involved in cell wall biosynthesis